MNEVGIIAIAFVFIAFVGYKSWARTEASGQAREETMLAVHATQIACDDPARLDGMEVAAASFQQFMDTHFRHFAGQ